MAALDSVQDFVDAARFLLQDTGTPARYSTANLVTGLNLAIIEIGRARPDLVFKAMRSGSLPEYSPSSLSTIVVVDYRYITPVVHFMAGYAQLSDEEEVEDARAAYMMGKLTGQLLSSTVAGGAS